MTTQFSDTGSGSIETLNKAALVTGGATRIGRFFAMHLAQQGYDVALHYHHSSEQATQVAEAIRDMGQACECLPCDFRQGDVETLISRSRARFPGLCVLVNSASAYAAAAIAETSGALLEEQFAVNLFAPFRLTRSFAKEIGEGDIVNILDNKIAFNQPAYAAYLLAKKSLGELTRMAALELAPRIRVNAIAPGVVLPASVRSDDYLAWRRGGIPLARQGELDELGQALDYLLKNRFVAGQTLFVDGGESLKREGRHSENYPGDL
ncbi:SDR family oxidoreductase [Halomonas sp. HP20-15]|uniref:SDR family oxidoreductase n=1 Tax=Halomonas sp. HP20-15 TaxID=3085901 RepID=UPI002982A2A5|nr:SDR family oxidoreductase [Halomonas sp. HP20-15]MDW5376134.1 SDR family oxidoreductase [Halomonas sp. HP20-15]